MIVPDVLPIATPPCSETVPLPLPEAPARLPVPPTMVSLMSRDCGLPPTGNPRYPLPPELPATVQAMDGRWVTIEAAPLEGEREGEVAVNLRSATANEKFELLCRVYALSQREREVVSLLVAGLDTRAIGKRLFISAHTVQDHLKSVFAKIGIHSRRELLATLSASSD